MANVGTRNLNKVCLSWFKGMVKNEILFSRTFQWILVCRFFSFFTLRIQLITGSLEEDCALSAHFWNKFIYLLWYVLILLINTLLLGFWIKRQCNVCPHVLLELYAAPRDQENIAENNIKLNWEIQAKKTTDHNPSIQQHNMMLSPDKIDTYFFNSSWGALKNCCKFTPVDIK